MYLPAFSHIYAEREALAYPLTGRVLKRLEYAAVVPVAHYKDIFNRPKQDFDAQKRSPKLILAVRQKNFLFPCPDLCERYGYQHVFYTTQMMNCVYDCVYCYLRGMYQTANVAAFVNTGDYFYAVKSLIDDNGPLYLNLSYGADILSLEWLFGFAGEWLAFAEECKGLTLEIRTKSAAFDAGAYGRPIPNVILAWTVSPEQDAALYEAAAPGLEARLINMRAAMEMGWNTRLCVDPVLLTNGWEERLERMAETVKRFIDVKALTGVSAGGFRVSKTYYRRMLRARPDSVINALPLEERNGVMAYTAADERRVKAFLNERLS